MKGMLLRALVLLLAWTAAAWAGEAASRTQVTLGTATAGGGFEAYGRALAEVLNAADPGLEVRPRATRGSTENVALLAAGRIDLALVTGEVAYEAFAASGEGAQAPRVLSAMYSTPGMFAVRAGSPHRRIEDLKGRRVIFGARGSGLVVLARLALEGLGLDMERDFDTVLLDRIEDAPGMLLDGRAEALWGGGAGWPPFVAVARVGARFIVPDAASTERIVARHGFLSRLVLPAGSYPGQDEPLVSVGTWSLILIRPGLDEELAYRLARALHRGEAELARALPRAAETSAANTLAAVPPGRLHPGVLRYLREVGLVDTSQRREATGRSDVSDKARLGSTLGFASTIAIGNQAVARCRPSPTIGSSRKPVPHMTALPPQAVAAHLRLTCDPCQPCQQNLPVMHVAAVTDAGRVFSCRVRRGRGSTEILPRGWSTKPRCAGQ